MSVTKAQKNRTTFRYEVRVEAEIAATPERVWSLITDAQELVRWNSTITSLDGAITDGSRISLVSTLAPERVFRLRVSDLVEARSMSWSDGFAPMFSGVRTYTIEPLATGRVRFVMSEVFRGLMLPMIAPSLPDFGPNFETWVGDLVREAERA